jgi:ribosomal protein S12 methylthiotransferase accessory factor
VDLGGSKLERLFTDRFQRSGLEYKLFCTTLDLGVPSFFGILSDARGRFPGVVVGGAASLDPERAVRKTLLELVQGLRWAEIRPAGHLAPDGGIPAYDTIQSFTDRADLYAFQDLTDAWSFIENDDVLPLREIPSLAGPDAAADVQVLVGLLAEQGLSPLAVDRTSSDLAECGIWVMKCVVPELETMEGDHRYPFLGGQRWRSVPVTLGRASAARDIADINPYPHPYP